MESLEELSGRSRALRVEVHAEQADALRLQSNDRVRLLVFGVGDAARARLSGPLELLLGHLSVVLVV